MSVQFLKAVLNRTLLLFGVWVILAGIDTKAIVAGTLAVPAAVWLSLLLLPARKILDVWQFAVHLPAFLIGSLRGGIDVGLRALSPDMGLRPGWIEVPSALDGGARAALGGELSLMPGTLAAGTQDGRLLVHVLDTEGGYELGIPRTEAAIAAMVHSARPAENEP